MRAAARGRVPPNTPLTVVRPWPTRTVVLLRRRPPALSLLLPALLLAAGCGGDGDAANGDAASDDTGGTPATAAAEAPADPSAVPAPELPPPAFGAATGPVVIGHRGAAGHHPDNSLEGFAAADDLGASWVELDVRLSADGEVVLHHDMATAAGTPIAGATAADLATEGIPTLDEALDVIDEQSLGVDVELKSIPTEDGYDPTLAVVDATVAVLQARPAPGPVVVSSFDRAALDRVRELAGDDLTTVFITQGIGGPEDLAASLVDGGHDGLAIGDPALPRSTFRVFADAGLPVWMWTIDSPAVAERVERRGAAGVITDVPDVISEALSD